MVHQFIVKVLDVQAQPRNWNDRSPWNLERGKLCCKRSDCKLNVNIEELMYGWFKRGKTALVNVCEGGSFAAGTHLHFPVQRLECSVNTDPAVSTQSTYTTNLVRAISAVRTRRKSEEKKTRVLGEKPIKNNATPAKFSKVNIKGRGDVKERRHEKISDTRELTGGKRKRRDQAGRLLWHQLKTSLEECSTPSCINFTSSSFPWQGV